MARTYAYVIFGEFVEALIAEELHDKMSEWFDKDKCAYLRDYLSDGMECEIEQIADNISDLVCTQVLEIIRGSYEDAKSVDILEEGFKKRTERLEDHIEADIKSTRGRVDRITKLLEGYEKELVEYNK